MKKIRLVPFSHSISKNRQERLKRLSAGQSLLELALVVVFLALVLAATVEIGFLLNQYLHVLDGAREAARSSSNDLAFVPADDGSGLKTVGGLIVDRPEFYYLAASKAASVMDPVTLNPSLHDDIVISVFSVSGSHISRFPLANQSGWSLCAHYSSFADYFISHWGAVQDDLNYPAWTSDCTVHTSQMSDQFVLNHMNASAPNTGVLLVEIFYNYPQLLKLPVFEQFMPDPIPLAVYTIMPLSSAEPTQVP